MVFCCGGSVAPDDDFKPKGDCNYTVRITVGDHKGSGTDANVFVIFHSTNDESTGTIKLDNFLRNDFEKGSDNLFSIKCKVLPDVYRLEIWRDDSGVKSDWFVKTVVVNDHQRKGRYTFPIFRWLVPDFHYNIRHLDTSLPQDDPYKEQRALDLAEKKKKYELHELYKGCSPVVKEMPVEEEFSFSHIWNLAKVAVNAKVGANIQGVFVGRWDSFDDYKKFFNTKTLQKPRVLDYWDTDENFGAQRIARQNNVMIELCTELPEKLAVTDELVKPLLEGNTLQQLIEQKRLFMIDYVIFEDLDKKTKNDPSPICAPIALFFVNSSKKLLPVAIQLHQTPGDSNPVFTPSDDHYVWLMAKMWFNKTDGLYQQAVLHFGGTHLLMEGPAVLTNRYLSPSHPIYKILLPHFLYLININNVGLKTLLGPDGWFEQILGYNTEDIIEAMACGKRSWRMDCQGTLPADLERRNVLDQNILPGYHYRDDTLPLYYAIKEYVTNYVNLYYDREDKLTKDTEIKNFAEHLVKPTAEGGCQWQGVPGNGRLENNDQLIAILTTIIFHCSVTHAVVNFLQYEEGAFFPNYSTYLKGIPPTDKTPLTEKDLVDCLPDKSRTIDNIFAMRVLSERATRPLGDFEVQYIFDPHALPILEKFRTQLKKISSDYVKKIRGRSPMFDSLDPAVIPNSISE